MRKEFNNLVAVMNRYDLYQANYEVGQALKKLEDKITELEKRMQCVVKCAKEIQGVTNKFEGSNGEEIKINLSDLEIIERASNDVELALDLNDGMCIEDNWYELFNEPEVVEPTNSYKALQDNQVVKEIIAKLRAIDVDGETMQYIIEQVGMSDQMSRQLIMSNPESNTKDLLEEKINLVNQNSRRKLAEVQLKLMDDIRANANINIVTCGNCGTLLLHNSEDESILCFGCKREMDLSDCPDYWYEGCLENGEFNDEPTKSYKNKVTKSAFLNWYFSDIDIAESVSNRVIADLKCSGKTTLTAQELFDECGYIPQYICEIDGDGEYVPSEVEFIQD
jgi:hypothetical protein